MVAALPPLNRLWVPRDHRTLLPHRQSVLRGAICRLRWDGSNLPSDCHSLTERLPNIALLHCTFRSSSWQDSFESREELCHCLTGYVPEETLEARGRIRTLQLRWEFGGPPAQSVPAMLSVAQCLPQITDLTLIGRGDGSAPALLDRLRSLCTLKRFAMTLDPVVIFLDGYLTADTMDAILSLPVLSRLELQGGLLSVGCLRALLSDGAEAFRKRVVLLKRTPAEMSSEAKALLAELEKLCPRLTPQS